MDKENIVKFLKRYNITIKTLGKHSGYSAVHLSRILQNDTPLTISQSNCIRMGLAKAINEKKKEIPVMWEDYLNL